MTTKAVVIGDAIAFSVQLLRQIADEPHMQRVRLKEIREAYDGTKVLVLEAVEEQS